MINIKLLLTELLKEETDNNEALSKSIVSVINKVKKNLGIQSVTPYNRFEGALVVRFEEEEGIDKKIKKINAVLNTIGGVKVESKKLNRFGDRFPVSDVTYKNDTGRIVVLYRYKIGSREGVVLEELIAYALTNNITDKLRDRLDLPPDAGAKEVSAAIQRDDIGELYRIAIKAKKLVYSKVRNVVKAETVGSSNSKADILLYDSDNNKFGLSVKLSFDREIRFEYNKNLGYGDEKEELVAHPKLTPWWVIGRKKFLENLKNAGKYGGKTYNPSKEDWECPAWMTKAKEQNPDVYRETMHEVYAELRSIFVKRLRRLKLSRLVAMVRQSHMGKKDEREQYRGFYRLTYDTSGIRIDRVGNERPNLNIIRAKGLSVPQMVVEDGSKIIIRIPGMEELTINSLKFHSNMLSSSKEDLKIKTR
jgi:hypothetical protein